MPIDWGYFTIMFVVLSATVATGFREGPEPWRVASNITIMILLGKGVAWLWGILN